MLLCIVDKAASTGAKPPVPAAAMVADLAVSDAAISRRYILGDAYS